MGNTYAEITPKIKELTQLCLDNSQIDASHSTRSTRSTAGCRDLKGKGVLTGLTEISEIQSSVEMDNGESVPCEGKLFYQRSSILNRLWAWIYSRKNGMALKKPCIFCLFGNLPSSRAAGRFLSGLLADYRTLPTSFVRDIIMKAPSPDMMNTLAQQRADPIFL